MKSQDGAAIQDDPKYLFLVGFGKKTKLFHDSCRI